MFVRRCTRFPIRTAHRLSFFWQTFCNDTRLTYHFLIGIVYGQKYNGLLQKETLVTNMDVPKSDFPKVESEQGCRVLVLVVSFVNFPLQRLEAFAQCDPKEALHFAPGADLKNKSYMHFAQTILGTLRDLD